MEGNEDKYLVGVDIDKCEIKNLNVNLRKKLDIGYPDLYISFSLKQNNIEETYLILLEAKLNSFLCKGQCEKYYNEVKNYEKVSKKIFLFLTLNGEACDCSDYINISYQDLIDYIYEKLLNLPRSKENIVLTLDEYLKSFNSIYEIDYKAKDHCIDKSYYPLTPKGKELTIKLWKKTKDIFSNDELWKELYMKIDKKNEKRFLIVRAFVISILNVPLPNNDEDNYKNEKLTTILKKLNKKFSIDNKVIEYTNDVVHELIKNLMISCNIKDKNNLDLRVKITTGKWKNICDEEEYNNLKEKEKEVYKQDENDKYYYVKSNESDVDNLINALKECYPDFADKTKVVPYVND
jgi:hypothetical protein